LRCKRDAVEGCQELASHSTLLSQLEAVQNVGFALRTSARPRRARSSRSVESLSPKGRDAVPNRLSFRKSLACARSHGLRGNANDRRSAPRRSSAPPVRRSGGNLVRRIWRTLPATHLSNVRITQGLSGTSFRRRGASLSPRFSARLGFPTRTLVAVAPIGGSAATGSHRIRTFVSNRSGSPDPHPCCLGADQGIGSYSHQIENQWLVFDLEILFPTIPVVLFGKGAY